MTEVATSDALTARLAERLADVRQRIAAAAERAGRSPSAITLVAVTKTQPVEVVRAAVAVGMTDLGESRVGELLGKIDQVDAVREGRRPVSWHFVGRLQRRKVRDVVGRGVLVHAVDRDELADELSRRAARAGVVQRVLVQVNVGGDPAKAGFPPDEALAAVARVRGLDHLAVEGLMTIPPLPRRGTDPDVAAAPHFAQLRELRDRARESWPEVAHLSMGMSADFEAAVEQGATIVRIGTALFGARPPAGPARPRPGDAAG